MGSLLDCVFGNDLDGLRKRLAQGMDPDERDGDGRTPLIHATLNNQLETATLLIDSGAQLDMQDGLGNSALHYAAQEQYPRIVSLLVDRGARVDVEDNYGNTPLWRAVFGSRGQGELITILLRAGADQTHRNKHGKTPVDLARSIANYNVAQFFG